MYPYIDVEIIYSILFITLFTIVHDFALDSDTDSWSSFPH